MKRCAALEAAIDGEAAASESMTDEEAAAAARVLLEQAAKRCPATQPEVKHQLEAALSLTQAPEEKQWGMDTDSALGRARG